MFAASFSSLPASSIIELNTTTRHDDLKMSQKEIAREMDKKKLKTAKNCITLT